MEACMRIGQGLDGWGKLRGILQRINPSWPVTSLAVHLWANFKTRLDILAVYRKDWLCGQFHGCTANRGQYQDALCPHGFCPCSWPFAARSQASGAIRRAM